jgi:hypothetical protein
MFNFGYIGGLVASWTMMNKRKPSKHKPNLKWLKLWLWFCFGFLIGCLIYKIILFIR